MLTACTASSPAALSQQTAVARTERTEEAALIAGLLADDPAAWRQFNDRYARLVHRCITRITVRFRSVVAREDVHEIYATFCLQLLANDRSKLRTFDPSRGGSLASWLSLLAANAAYDFLRRRRREPGSDECADELPLGSTLPDPYEVCELRERAAIAASMIAHFSERDQEFLKMYYGDGLTPEQIAQRMNVSVKTVYSKKHKLQHRLEALMGARGLAAA